jgi:iron uptake system EfeUOB component EfeO/EfeM
VRKAVLIAALCLAGCGGGKRTPAVTPTATSEATASAPAATKKIAGTDMSAQDVADAAAGVPLNGNVRPELVPLPERAFEKPIARYRSYSARQAATMQTHVRTLARAVRDGDRGRARRAWTDAYEAYTRLGAAYGALGDLDAAIVADRERLERGLWRGESLTALRPAAARLERDVRTLRRVVGRVEITPLDYATRAHEILEDAQRDMLSGAAAPYSGAGVHATAASLEATEAVVDTLRGVLAERGALAPVETGLQRLRRELAAIRRAHGGSWPALDDLSRTERERLNGRLGAGLELLAQLPGALETIYPPAIPTIQP